MQRDPHALRLRRSYRRHRNLSRRGMARLRLRAVGPAAGLGVAGGDVRAQAAGTFLRRDSMSRLFSRWIIFLFLLYLSYYTTHTTIAERRAEKQCRRPT